MAADPVPCHCPRERSLRWAEGVTQISGPPVVLVRCDGRLSEQPGASECLVDDSRDCQTLGWEHARPGLVSQVLSCDAHHFNIFLGGQVSSHIATRDCLLFVVFEFPGTLFECNLTYRLGDTDRSAHS
jgi:hypothetical protein